MNKAFEKILERLEETSVCEDDTTCNYCQKNWCPHLLVERDEVEKIVNDIAEGYNNGWIACSERLPDNDKNEYIVQKTSGFIDILGFTKDAYKLDRYDFAEYKGKKKQLFYDYDSEYGYIECECVAWQPLPEPFKERD